LLGLPEEELLRELRFLPGNGRHYGGADAIVALAREIWWARPLSWVANVPTFMAAFRRAYKGFAERRNCHAVRCRREQPA
jgi:hypothetical protein